MSLLTQLNTLESAGLVRIAQLEPDLEYLFRHALVREAAYSSILSVDQKELHRAVGEAIETLYPNRIDEYAAMLSYHFGEAGDAVKAKQYCTLAGKIALASFANQEAENHFRCALALVIQITEKAELLHLLGEALYRQSRYDETIQTWQEGIQLYKAQGDLPGVARLYARSARAAWYMGDHPEGLRLSLEGLESVKDMPKNPSKAMLIHEVARAYHFNGYPEEAEPLCRTALEMAAEVGAVDIQADALTTFGVLPNVTKEEALESLARAVELAESNGLMEIATRANHNLGVMSAEHLGDQKASRDYYLHAAELAQQRGAANEEIFSLISAAGVSLVLGELNTGREIMERIKEIKKTLLDLSQVNLEFAGIEFGLNFLQGEFEAALGIIRAAREESRQRGDLQMLHNYCTSQADVFLVRDYVQRVEDWSEAIDAAKEGIEISNKGISRSLQSHKQLAVISIRTGKLEEARRIQSEARQLAGDSPTLWNKQALLEIEREMAKTESDWQAALDAADEASKQLANTGMRWPWAYALVEWAEIHLARGEAMDFERARTLFREALAVFEQMGSLFFVDLIEDRLRDLRERTIAVTIAHGQVSQELVQAGKIQGSFMPEEIPVLEDWDISAILKPARQTSGDFYDFIQLPGERIGMIVADVADKGMGAALYMTTCRTLIRTFAGEHPDEPELVLAKVNRRILADTHGGLFITVFYAVLDTITGVLKYCNAGHNPPFLFSQRDGDSPLELSRTGMPLGILDEADWEQGEIQLGKGDLLICYTDGITESQDREGNFFGEEELAALVQSASDLPVVDIQNLVLDRIRDFSRSSSQFDDMTLLVVKRN